MTTEKFVVRLLDADGRLLAWAELVAVPKPQARGASCPLWATGPTLFAVEHAGMATEVSIHWCDLDVARRASLIEPAAVEVGQVFAFAWIEPVWLVAGMRDVPLPGVTVRRSVTIGIPVGELAAVAN
jgi:hypothetical protein